MKDRMTIVGLAHSDDTMSFALIFDVANDGTQGELDLKIRSDDWIGGEFPQLLRDDPADEFKFDETIGKFLSLLLIISTVCFECTVWVILWISREGGCRVFLSFKCIKSSEQWYDRIWSNGLQTFWIFAPLYSYCGPVTVDLIILSIFVRAPV